MSVGKPKMCMMTSSAVAVSYIRESKKVKAETLKADWDIIRQVKEAVSIPVIGNGDVVSGESAIAIQKETGCDGVMIGRGAQGNPWIFSELLEYERTGKMPLRPSVEAIKKMMIRHAQLLKLFSADHFVPFLIVPVCSFFFSWSSSTKTSMPKILNTV